MQVSVPLRGLVVFNTRRYALLKTISSLLKNGMELKIVLNSVIPFTTSMVFMEELKKANELSKKGKTNIWTGNLLSEIEKVEIIDETKCIGCRQCELRCPDYAIFVEK